MKAKRTQIQIVREIVARNAQPVATDQPVFKTAPNGTPIEIKFLEKTVVISRGTEFTALGITWRVYNTMPGLSLIGAHRVGTDGMPSKIKASFAIDTMKQFIGMGTIVVKG